MIKHARNYSLYELFNISARVVYTVPRYQREYSWTKTHCESLFDDIQESAPGYFLGSIICINQARDALSVQNLELVDGQQRLITLFLLLAAVYHVLSNREVDLEDEQINELRNLKRMMVLTKNDDQIRVVPQFQNRNNNDFRALLGKIGIISPCDTPPNAGNRKIFRAFNYFQDRLKPISDGDAFALTKIFDFLEQVNQSSMVKIEVDSHAEAYTLFESLNNRGMPLTPIDLIKNKLMAKLERAEPRKIEDHFAHWNDLLKYLGDDYTVQERFFRQYYNAFKDDLPSGKESIATRSNLIQIYERLIDADPKEFLDKTIDAGRLYSLLLSRRQDDSMRELEKPLKDLERIQGAPSYQLMLYLLTRLKDLHLGIDHIAAIAKLMVCFFVRRNLTDIPPTRDLIRLFMTIVEKLNGVTGKDITEVIRDQLHVVSASDDEFRRKLEGDIYEENAGVTRFILCALAEEGMTEESWVDLWKIENKRFFWSIEHVFPQGENIPPSWVTMIAGGDEQKAKEYQQTHVHKLGNLTLSGFNSTLGNKSFEEKRDRKDTEGRYVGYKNGLKLNEDLATPPVWSVHDIEKRTLKLVNQTMIRFKMC